MGHPRPSTEPRAGAASGTSAHRLPGACVVDEGRDTLGQAWGRRRSHGAGRGISAPRSRVNLNSRSECHALCVVGRNMPEGLILLRRLDGGVDARPRGCGASTSWSPSPADPTRRRSSRRSPSWRRRAGSRLTAGHVDHGLRGAESAARARGVAALARAARRRGSSRARSCVGRGRGPRGARAAGALPRARRDGGGGRARLAS